MSETRTAAHNVQSISIAIVDDDFIVRSALASILAGHPDLEVLWTASSGEEALELAGSVGNCPDVMLVDLQMPGIGGLALCREVHSRHPRTAILLVTTLDVESSLGEALAAGASGFLVKDEAPATLAQAVRAANIGTSVFSQSAQRALSSHYAPHNGPHERKVSQSTSVAPNPLTRRELEVLNLVARSKTNHQIARELNLSEATVKTHVSAIIVKLDCVDRVGMVAWAFRNGVVS